MSRLFIFFTICLFSCSLYRVRGGHIFSQPSELVPQNAKFASSFHLFFSLETQLTTGDFLYFKFPFLLGALPTATLYTNLDYSQTIGNMTLIRSTGTDPEHFFSLQSAGVLQIGVWYRIKIVADLGVGSQLAAQLPGAQGCVSMMTTSDTSSERIVYDINTCLDYITLGPEIDKTLFKVSGLFSAKNSAIVNSFSQSYTAYFDVIPSVLINGASAIVLEIDKTSDFQFGSACASVACLASSSSVGSDCPGAYDIPLVTSTCSALPQTLTFVLTQPVQVGVTFRIQATIINSKTLVPSARTIEAIHKSVKSETWFAYTVVGVASTNGLQLKTSYPQYTVSGTNSFFWGLTYASFTTSSVGCPIVLYRNKNSGNRIVFNSITTSFTLSVGMTSLPGSIKNLQINWTPLEDASETVYSIIMGSFSSNLVFLAGNSSVRSCTKQKPSTVVYINCKNLDSIQAATYTVGVKLSITSRTSDPAGAATVGKIIFQTGEDTPTTIATFAGSTVVVKGNIEYDDNTFTTSSNNQNKNGVFSFDYSITEFTTYPLFQTRSAVILDSVITALVSTVKCYFLGESCAGMNSYNKGRVGLWAKPSSDGDSKYHGVFMPLKSSCDPASKAECHFCVNTFSATASICSSGLAPGTSLAVMLKVIFNNNVLKIPSSDLNKGVKLVGYAFAILATGANPNILAATATAVKDYDSNGDILTNYITQTTTFAHLTLVCTPPNGDAGSQLASNINYNCYYMPGVGTSGIAFYNTKIATYPTFYVDNQLNDFIICAKGRLRSSYPTLASVDETTTDWTVIELAGTAGPGIINSYVITKGAVTSTSYASYVNAYYYSTPETSSGDYYATYLRVYASFASSFLPTASAFAGVFFDGTRLASLTDSHSIFLKYSFANQLRVVNQANANGGSTVDATIIRGADGALTTNTILDFWSSQSGVIFPSSTSTSASIINVYIPCLFGFTKLNSVNIALMSAPSGTSSLYGVNAVIRVFGGVWDATSKTQGSSYTPYTLTTVATGNVITKIDTWASSTPTGAYEIYGAGCMSTNGAASTKLGIRDAGSTNFKPGNTITNTKISAEIAKVNTDAQCLIKDGNTIGSNLGQAYILYALEKENIFNPSATISWDYASSGINSCIYHDFAIYDNTKNYALPTKNFWTILCQADTYSSVSFGSASNGLTLSSFTIPFYWGENYSIKDKIHHVWSNNIGHCVTVAKEASSSSSTWKQTTCTAGSISGVAQDTKDVYYTLTLSTQTSYKIPRQNVADTGKFTIEETVTSTSPSFVGCEFTGILVCTAGGGNVFRLALPAIAPYIADQDYTISKGTISILIIIDNTGSVISTTHSAKIKFNDVVIEECSVQTPVTYDLNSAKINNIITLSSLTYINMKGARGTFSFSFAYNRPIRSNYVFIFNLGFFVNPTQTSKNARCIITDTAGRPSNNFKTLSTLDLLRSTLTVKNPISQGGIFIFKCIGGATSDFSTNIASSITATYSRGSSTDVASTTADTALPPNSALDQISPQSFTMAKYYRTSGFDSDYLFSFIPYTSDIQLTGRIYVEFSNSIPPRLNYGGIAECYINEIPAFCHLVDERRVQIWPNMILSKNSTKVYVLKICGVTQPSTFDENANIYFGLDVDDNPYTGILEQSTIAEIFETTTTAKPSIIYVHDFSILSNKIRTTTSISVTILLAANTVTATGSLYAQFPASFHKSLFHSPSSFCSLRRIGDNTGFEFAKSCSLLRARRFIINLNYDSQNVNPMNYTLTFTNILSPQNVNPLYFREDIKIFTVSADNITILSTTGTGNRNSTNYIGFVSENTYTLLNWMDAKGNWATNSYLDVNIGIYSAFPALATSTGSNYNNTFTWQFGGSNSSIFLTQQVGATESGVLKIFNGFPKSSFYIGASESVNPGIYYLSTTKNGDISNTYSSVPFLDIRTVNTKCNILINGNTFNVPVGGFSPPIILDFSKCIPMTDIIVTANITSGAKLFMKFDNGLVQSSQTLKFNGINANYMMYFYVYSENSNSNITSGSSALNFEIAGTDGKFYTIGNAASLALTPAVSDLPIVLNPQVIPQIGETTFSFSCSQAGYIYYAAGLGDSPLKIGINTIADKSQNIKVSITKPDVDDIKYLIYGYISYQQANVFQAITVQGRLKAGDNYTLVSYCMNQNSVRSNNTGVTTFIQPDNGGKTISINIKFKLTTLTDAQRVDIACAMARFFAIDPRRVQTEDGFFCLNLKRILQTTNATTTNTTNNTTPVTPVTTSYNWFIIKDYLSPFDQSYQTYQTQVRDTSFTGNLLKLTTAGVKGFPTIDSVSSLVVDSLSTSNNANAIPIIQADQETIGLTYVSIPLKITNIDGYLFTGIGKYGVTTPSMLQLRNGLDGNATSLLQKQYRGVINNTLQIFNFTGLTNNTNYTLFYGASNSDPSINSLTTTVTSKIFTTLSPDFAEKLTFLGILISLIVLTVIIN